MESTTLQRSPMRRFGDLIERWLLPQGVVRDQTAWRTLDFLNLFRLLVATVLLALLITPPGFRGIPYAGPAVAIVAMYLALAPVLLMLGRRWRRALAAQILLSLGLDLLVMIGMTVFGPPESGIAVMLAGAMAVSGVLLPLRLSLFYASVATVSLIAVAGFVQLVEKPQLSLPAAGALGAAYFALVLLGGYLGRRVRESQALAVRRAVDLATMAELNEQILQRMRTGVLVVNSDGRVRVMNDSARYLLGLAPSEGAAQLDHASPLIWERLQLWFATGDHLTEPVRLMKGVPKIVPRFADLGGGEGETLVFLEDTSMVSRRAHEMTLASLGRLSASIAHEIRNPLSAISHSAQLLAEAELDKDEKRLIRIVSTHCKRLNDIVENVLQLARQERAKPEVVALGSWLQHFIEDFKETRDLLDDQLSWEQIGDDEVYILVDPSQLQQVVWNLTVNALRHGRQPDQPANVRLICRYQLARTGPTLEVCDDGPGVSDEAREEIFEPFFTTANDGSGLGLYLCRQLAEANHARLEYQTTSQGGACFRISFTSPREAAAWVSSASLIPENALPR